MYSLCCSRSLKRWLRNISQKTIAFLMKHIYSSGLGLGFIHYQMYLVILDEVRESRCFSWLVSKIRIELSLSWNCELLTMLSSIICFAYFCNVRSLHVLFELLKELLTDFFDLFQPSRHHFLHMLLHIRQNDVIFTHSGEQLLDIFAGY